ncbi:ABC transporter ATP-binding protein [Vineibacter terrae]|uniref:ABC transporter ATP-binding protein n=1 Tax=Vineibacter terrae TaxID=2586908 RepID=A0A5C8PMT2_9HYPH|nr:ABC transporter ATP-binding protein [Vineibacter terrae]TXL75222.1 ABC transporter ATP-binding protein [Vineibacter terrae]
MAELLAVERLRAGYAEAVVLDGVSLSLREGEALALLGRNGAGKTTLITSLLGLTTWRAGSIRLAGRDITRLAPERRARAGIGWVPQERNIFRSLSVEENLTAILRPGPWSVPRVFELFPRLAERRRNLGDQLSGGEQQMLAIARALVLNPRLVLLDEPLEGLAPIIVEEVLAALGRILRDEGLAAIVVEQKARQVLAVTDRAVILDRGTVVHDGPSAALLADPRLLEARLAVGDKGA